MNTRWMWVTLAALLAVVPWARWWDAPRELEQARRVEVFNPAQEARDEARREALRVGFQIQALRQIERFSTAAVEARDAGAALDLGPLGQANERLLGAERFPLAERRARSMLDRWELDEPRVAVGLYLPHRDLDWPERADMVRPPTSRWGRIIDGRLAGGRPYCIQVGRLVGAPGQDVRSRTVPNWALLDDSDTGPGAYGACWVHARYGEPGPHVAEWMRTTGLSAAISWDAHEWWAETDDSDRLLLNALGLRKTAMLNGGLGPETRLADRCIAGDAAACRAVFTLPTGGARFATEASLDEAVPNSATVMGFTSNYLPENWLHTLEATYGPERMAAFWTSEADVVTAFEEAFDTDLETAMMELGRERFGHADPGPRVAGWGWMGLLAALALGIGGAVGAVRRRSVA